MASAWWLVILACASAVLVHPTTTFAEGSFGSVGWLLTYYSLLAIWAISVAQLWRAERKAFIRIAIAVVPGIILFGLLAPQAFAFTTWSLFGFAP